MRRGLPPGHRAVGLRQVDGMPREPQRGKIKGRARHQKSTTRTDTCPHGVTRGDTATSRNGPCRYGTEQASALTQKRSAAARAVSASRTATGDRELSLRR